MRQSETHSGTFLDEAIRRPWWLSLNSYDVPAEWADESLLFLLREHFGPTGTKFGCGVGICWACTIILDGVATRACTTRAGDVDGLSVRAIEGLAKGDVLHPVQHAWLDHGVPQCGYCQAGQIMAAVALLEHVPDPSTDDIELAMDRNPLT